MARSDLLINLVKAGASGDTSSFRKVVDLLIAEERGKNHDILADRLAQATTPVKSNGHGYRFLHPSTPSLPNDLYYELVSKRTIEDLLLPDDVLIAVRELVEEQNRHDLLRS